MISLQRFQTSAWQRKHQKEANIFPQESWELSGSSLEIPNITERFCFENEENFLFVNRYVAPEYAMTGHLLVKSDVYSYGVVLVELLTGRKPVDMSQPQGSENLVTWARPLLTSQEGLQKLVDPSLHGNFDFDNLAKVAAIASMCVHSEPSQRPFMGEVVQALKLICNSMDENNEETCIAAEYESNSWNESASQLNHGLTPFSFVSMEDGSNSFGDLKRISKSGPLRTKRKRSAFHRLRGSMSDHQFLSRRIGRNGYWL